MRIALFFFLINIQILTVGQQNLVLNPSFEDTLSMTNNIIYPLCQNWWNPNDGTSDYLSPYSNELNDGRGVYFDLPCNDIGCMEAHDGSAYIGMVTYHSTGPGKDWAQGVLSEPLIAGESYCISLWLASGDSCGFKTCDFHVAFTEEPVNDAQLVGTFNFPDPVSFNTSDLSPEYWINYQAVYIASGNEQFIYLGSNTPNDLITCAETLSDGWVWNSNYVLVDNISVQKSSLCTTEVRSSNDKLEKPTIFPNPTHGNVTIRFESNSKWEVMIFTSLGKLIYVNRGYSQEIQLELDIMSNQICYLEIKTESNFYREKLLFIK